MESSRGDGTYQEKYDLDGNDVIGIPDFLIFVDHFGTGGATTGGGGGGGSGGSPDLIVESPSVSDEILSPGQSFTLGQRSAIRAMVRLSLRPCAIIAQPIRQLPPAILQSVRTRWRIFRLLVRVLSQSVLQAPNTPGSYYYGACVESVSRESDTENNCSTGIRVTVASSNTFDANCCTN